MLRISKHLPQNLALADITIWEIIDKLNEKRVPSQYGVDELEEDLKAFDDE